MRDARGGKQHTKVFKGMGEGLWKRKLHEGVCPHQFSFLQEVWSAIGGAIQDLSLVMNSVFLERDQLMKEERGLRERLSV